MKSANKKSHLLHVLVSVTMGASLVQASGYEKGILWGGKYSGVAGVGSPGVKGSDSIFYNPAGLVKSSEFGEFVLIYLSLHHKQKVLLSQILLC